jgi:hypothetical protein
MFIKDKYEDYTLEEFDDMCDIALMMLLAKEEYENAVSFLILGDVFMGRKGGNIRTCHLMGLRIIQP